MIWKLLPQMLTVLVTAIVAVLDYVWHDKRTKKFRTTMVWLFLSIVLLMAVSIIEVLKGERADVHEKEALRSQLALIKNSIESAKPYFDLYINDSTNPA